MFGYIAINKAEMNFKDFDIYQSYYCGLCKHLKEEYGKRGQLTLSYDMTFLIVLLSGLYEPDDAKDRVSCIAHPLQKHNTCTNEFTTYAADMNLVLSYYKCKDDWDDERKKKSLLFSKLLQSKIEAIRLRYPDKVALIASRLQQIRANEDAGETDLDTMAGLFGEIMAEICVYKKDEWEYTLRNFGFFLGKFIYLMDAYEDIEEDVKNHSYNPLKDIFEREDFDDYCKQLLTMMIAECSRAFESLPIITHAEILRNILYSGVWCRYEMIVEKKAQKKTKDISTKAGDNK